MKNLNNGKKKAAPNKQFHTSGGVCPQTVLYEFASASPAFIKPPPR